MRACPSCGRAYAEILGAPQQRCPHCGHVVASASPPAQVQVQARAPGGVADPVAAASLALRTFARRYLALSLAWLPAFAAYLAASVAVALLTRDIASPATSVDEELRYLGVAVPPFALAIVVELACWALVARALQPEPAKVRVGALAAMGATLALAWFAGALLLVVPFLIFFHWFMFVPAAVAEGQTLGRAFESSRAFARERRTYGFTALVLVVLIASALVSSGLLAPLLSRGLAAAFPRDVADAVGDALATWALGPLVPLFPAAYWELAKLETAGAAPTATAADAHRWTTTKCPQCSTLIPYAATGAPVHVACPVCGREGDVV